MAAQSLADAERVFPTHWSDSGHAWRGSFIVRPQGRVEVLTAMSNDYNVVMVSRDGRTACFNINTSNHQLFTRELFSRSPFIKALRNIYGTEKIEFPALEACKGPLDLVDKVTARHGDLVLEARMVTWVDPEFRDRPMLMLSESVRALSDPSTKARKVPPWEQRWRHIEFEAFGVVLRPSDQLGEAFTVVKRPTDVK